jgi:hypothetical protein
MKPNRYTLKKIEALLEELDYDVIYDRGQFHSGYCVVEQQKKIVINKYYDVEGRVNNLMEIVDKLEIYPHLLSEKSKDVYLEIKKMQTE